MYIYTYHDGDKKSQYMAVLMALGCSVLAPVSLRGVMEGEGVIGKCKSNARERIYSVKQI